MQQLEEVSSSGEEETEHTPSPSPPPPPEMMSLDFDIPSPKTYLAKLKASLEKSTRYTDSKSKHLKSSRRHHSSRKRHLTSPLSIKGSRVPEQRLLKSPGDSGGDDDLFLSSDSSPSSSSSSESITLTTVDIGRSKRAMSSKSPMHSHFSPVSKGILGGAGRVTAWDQPTIHRSTTNGGTTSLSTSLLATQHHHDRASSVSSDEKSDIMSSLQMINGQLGELLCRLGPPQILTPAAATTTTAPLALPSYSRYTPSPVSSFVVGDIGTASLYQQNSTLLNTSGK